MFGSLVAFRAGTSLLDRCVTFWVGPLMYDIDDWGSGGGEGGAVVVGDVL